MSAIGAVSDVMPPALMVKPSSGSKLPQPPPGVTGALDTEGSAAPLTVSSTGKLVNISA